MRLLRLFTIFSVLIVSGVCVPVDTSAKDSSSSSSDGSKTPPPPRDHGEFVGVRPGAYEKKTKELKSISIHPGVVVGGPNPETGRYSVAMISKKLPHDPPQAPIDQYHPVSTVYGNVALSPPKQVRPEDMKGWINEKTGAREKHMNGENLSRLTKDMEPHADWRPPTPPPKPPTPPPKTPSPPPPKSPKRVPAKKKQQNLYAHASGSKQQNNVHAIGSKQQNNAHASGSKHVNPFRQGGTKHATTPKHGEAGHGHHGSPGSPSTHGPGNTRHSATGSSTSNPQHGKAPRRSSSPGKQPNAKKAPRRSSSPGPRPHSRTQGKKAAHGGSTKPAGDHPHKHKR